MNARDLCFAAVLCITTLGAPPVSAAQRTFVASYGLETNPCSITAPCRSFTRALTQTDANGEVLVLDSAGYGAFTITQSVSVIAPEGVYAGISVFAGAPNASHGIVVNGAGIKVTLRGLTINGQGGDDGIRIENAGLVFIEKVTVANAGNDFFDAAIRVAAAGSRVFATDTTVRGSAGYGINIKASTAGTVEVSIARSTLDSNAFYGVSVGLGAGGAYRVAITDSVLRRNGGGISVFPTQGETATALVGDNRVVGHGAEGISCGADPIATTATLVAERNEVFGNSTGLFQDPHCTFKSMGNNTVENNGTDVSGTITTTLLR